MKNIRHINILPPTLLLGLSAFLSSVLGVIRDRLLAQAFGASSSEGIYNLDAYYAAFKIPDLLFFILISGAISAAFVPLFTQYKKQKKYERAWKFASNMLHLMLIFVGATALFIFIFAPQFTRLVATGFEGEAFDLTVRLMRIMLLSPLIFTFSAVFMSLQDSFKTFFFRAFSPLFYNAGIILSIILFADEFGVFGVTWGVIIGAVFSLLIQLPALPRIGYKHYWVAQFSDVDVKKSLRMMVPRILSTSMYQFSQLAYTAIASFLATGSITILYFANNLYALPLAIVAVSFSITSFATLSELALEKTFKPFANEMKRVMQEVLFLVFPATVGMFLLRDQIIDAILVTGKFTAEDAMLTSHVLFYMLISLFTHSLNLLLVRGFFAYHDTKTPFYANVIGAVGGVASAYFLSKSLGVIGVGIGISLGNILVFLMLYILMRNKLSESLLDMLNVLKMILVSFLMGMVVFFAVLLIPFPEAFWLKLLYLIFVGLLGIFAYLIISSIFKIPERQILLKQLRRMF